MGVSIPAMPLGVTRGVAPGVAPHMGVAPTPMAGVAEGAPAGVMSQRLRPFLEVAPPS